MAKKEKTTRTYRENTYLPKVCAFVALATSAILMLIGPLLRWLLSGALGSLLMSIVSLLSQYCLLVAIAIPAWYFVRVKSKGWRVAYFVFLVIYIAGTILGVTLGI